MSALMVRNIQDLRQANTPRLLEYICSLNFNVLWVAEHLRSVSLNHSTSCSPRRVNLTPTILPPDHCRSRWSAQPTMVQTSGISEDMVRLESVPWPATGNDTMLQNFFPANQVYISQWRSHHREHPHRERYWACFTIHSGSGGLEKHGYGYCPL